MRCLTADALHDPLSNEPTICSQDFDKVCTTALLGRNALLGGRVAELPLQPRLNISSVM